MKDMYMGNEKAKLILKSKLLLGAIALVVIAGLATGVYAAPAKKTDKSLSEQTSTLDPFTLQSTRLLVAESADGSRSVQGQVMVLGNIIQVSGTRMVPVIPFRLPCRSSYRPPTLVPGLPQ